MALCLVTAPATQAKDDSNELAALRAQLAAIQSRLEQLEKHQSPPLNQATQAQTTVTIDHKGFFTDSPDKQFTFRIRPRIQIDARCFIDSDDGNSGFTARRVRPAMDGKAGPVKYRVMPELAGTVRIIDAWASLQLNPYTSLQLGKFKGPIGLERLQSFSQGLFMERGLPSELTPVRELGIALNRTTTDGILDWTLGLYNGSFDGTDQAANANLGTNDGFDAGLRFFAHPFRNTDNLLNGLGVGIALSYGSEKATIDNSNADSRIRYRTAAANTFFKYKDGVVADGDRIRLNPQLYYYHGPFGILGEWIRSSQDFTYTGVSTQIDSNAWTLQAGWVLTGENASFKAVRPAHPFDPSKDQWGAFELGLRYSTLEVGDEAFLGHSALAHGGAAQQADSWSLAFNWYLTDILRISLNYSDTAFSGLGVHRESEEVLLSRFQVDF